MPERASVISDARRGLNIPPLKSRMKKVAKIVVGLRATPTNEPVPWNNCEIFALYRPHGLKVYSFVGDGTGVIHVGPNQIVIAQIADHELFEVNVYVHKHGHFHLPPTFSCYGISITTR